MAASLGHFAVSRLIFLICFVLARLLFATPAAQTQGIRDQPVPFPPAAVLRGIAELSATSYGDFGWYESLGRDGYAALPYTSPPVVQRNWCFFPVQAWLTRLVQRPVLRFLLGMLCGLAGTLLTAAVLADMFGPDTAHRAMHWLLYFPFSYVLTQFRPESVLFFLIGLALFLRGPVSRWRGSRPAAVFALLAAGLCKPNGFLLAVLWLPDLLRSLRPGMAPLQRLVAAALVGAPCVGLLVMSGWMYLLTGAPFAWAQEQKAWGADFIGTPWRQMTALLSQPMLIDRYGWDPILLDWLIWAGMWVSVAMLLWRRHFASATFLLATSLLSFANFGVWVQGKHLAPVYAYFAGLGLIRPPGGVQVGIVAMLAMLLAIGSILAGAGFHSFLF